MHVQHIVLSRIIFIISSCLFDGGEGLSKSVPRLVSYAKTVPPELFPYIAEILTDWSSREAICTASLLSRSVMITAGHCVIDEKTEKQLGKIKNVIFRQKYGRPYAVQVDGIVHGAVNIPHIEENKKIVDYALFTLKKPLPVCKSKNGKIFSIIKLPVEDIEAPIWKPMKLSNQTFTKCSLLGYGTSEKGGPDGQLRRITNISAWEVSGRLLIPLEPNVKKGRACAGDSGGPLICDTDFGERLFGIVSHSEPPVESIPSSCHGEENAFLYDVMSDVREMLPLIQNSFRKLNKTNELLEDNKICSF